MPSRSQIIGFIRGAVSILIEVRVLIAELMFSAATLYACYITYKMLAHKGL